MSGASLTFDIDDALEGLSLIRTRSQDLRRPLRSIARDGVASTRRRFQTGRAPDGTPWKKGHKTSGQTLILSTLLLRSISDRPPTQTSVEWGSNRSYAAVHQFGFDGQVQVSAHTRVVRQIFGRPLDKPITQNVGSHSRHMVMPARPYLGISAEDRTAFTKIVVRYVIGQAEAAS
jgi:phage virion morphogenesis protein